MKQKTNVITIDVSGRVQVGKSAIIGSIVEFLENNGYCVARPDRADRNNPPDGLDACATHERPKIDNTVIIVTESVYNTQDK